MNSRMPFLWLSLFFAGAVSLANAAQDMAPTKIDPHQLRIIPHQRVQQALSLSSSRSRTLTSPAGPLAPGLPLCVEEGETIVGACPQTGISTTVNSSAIPVILNITQGGTAFSFDPTAGDDDCLGAGNHAFDLTLNSPLYSTTDFILNGEDEGVTQYIDAFANAQFSLISVPGYHVLLNGTAGPPLVINVDAGGGGNATATIYNLGGMQCGMNPDGTNPPAKLAVINIFTIDPMLQNYISSHGLDPTQFPFFVLYNAVISEGPANNPNNCCILGYHNALGSGQTYAISEFEGRNQTVFLGVSDTAVGAHEIGEWLDDPNGTNPVSPPWGNIGQVIGCQGNLEVGDPLTGTLMPPVTMPNGFTYNLQELAFFSWFTRDNPSLAATGVYSSNGTFQGFAMPCPPGGTN